MVRPTISFSSSQAKSPWTMEGEDSVTFGPDELMIVPKGQIHRPRAAHEAQILLIEPTGEPNTGDSGAPPASKDRI
ncbi:hypothetical protein N9Y42_05470 [Mariniblastus sp.]|nr:hypothetical protein [Mariniblastus sp.]